MEYTTQRYDNAAAGPLLSRGVDEEETLQPSDSVTLVDYSNAQFRAHDFADKQRLAGWFPEINNNDETSWHIRFSKRNKALLLQIALITTVFITNIALIVYASLKYPSRQGVGLIYVGDCETVQASNRYLHLLINLLSTGMLSASNFCIQLQASPTRTEVDHVHEHNSWVDIGVPSIRNLSCAATFVAVASGNQNVDAANTSPASEPSACTVSASDDNDAKAGFSNYGSVVDIWAPGTNIKSTSYEGGSAKMMYATDESLDQTTASGTSAASPIVAGLGAYLLAFEGGRNPIALCKRIKEIATHGILKNVPSGTTNALAFNGNPSG
ncbi:hypothetical protein NUW58_g255 [Xylaria curta]|uniref:Uncharacterized protein n=1 Tax=Xylaria curta TaxID=42375 RepID=A0ACC1PQ07_9PEZI|nr:hypothetical protein NUW58_g255 [Xylaria curta]